MNTQATLIKASVGADQMPIYTFHLHLPLSAWVQVLTHRTNARNAASMRAMRTTSVVDNVRASHYRPSMWTKAQKGMVPSSFEVDDPEGCDKIWDEAMEFAIQSALKLAEKGAQKEAVNRLLSPFHMIDAVVTGVYWDNFLTLRRAPDAQEDIRDIAYQIGDLIESAEPQFLEYGEWHMPNLAPISPEYCEEDQRLICSGQLARVSYGNLNSSNNQADLKLGHRLFLDKHLSPPEHINQWGLSNRSNPVFGPFWTSLRHSFQE